MAVVKLTARNIAKAEIEPALGSRRPEEITRREVRTFVETIAEPPVPIIRETASLGRLV